jgi:UDP-N-acetylglucosamine:LPS N-acetylglucosamine transferase
MNVPQIRAGEPIIDTQTGQFTPFAERFINGLVNAVNLGISRVPSMTAAEFAALAVPTDPIIVYVSDATAGQRFKGYDVSAVAWVVIA